MTTSDPSTFDPGFARFHLYRQINLMQIGIGKQFYKLLR